jgi:hypothetical protein
LVEAEKAQRTYVYRVLVLDMLRTEILFNFRKWRT